MIKAILWDVDGTLVDFLASEKNSIRYCFDKFNIGSISDEALKKYSEINKKYWKKLERGEVTRAQVLTDRFKEFFSLEGIKFTDFDAFNAEYQVRLGDTAEVNDNAYCLLKSLNNVSHYAVTNGTKTAQLRKLTATKLLPIFDGVFISEEVGAEKPTVEYFNRVFSKIPKYQKSEMMIVGDSLTSDILGGNNAGIKTCWYNPCGDKANGDFKIDYEIKNLNEIVKIIG